MKSKLIFFIVFVDFFILLYEASLLSISYSESLLYFNNHSLISFLANFSTQLFGHNDIALRLPMILLHIFSVLLLYKISFFYIKKERERILLIFIYILLPGVISSALILNAAGMVLFFTLLFIYLYKSSENKLYSYILLAFLVFLDNSFQYLFLSLMFYSYHKKEIKFFIYSMFLLVFSLFLFGTDIGGYPTGHLLDTLALYSAICSPIVFVYLVYILYRYYLMKELDIIWFISAISLIFSLLLSLRQRIHIEYYAPFLIVSLPLAAKIFISSYKVRLPIFRKRYKLLFNISLIFLIFNFSIILTNRFLYLILDKPQKHFAYKNNIAKELAYKLKEKGIDCIYTDYKMQLRLKFYGINECQDKILKKYPTKNAQDVSIRYINKPVYQAFVTKINIK
jgi:hypothetical protein